MEGSAVAGWQDFLVAVAGAASALAGLLFVALSINLSRILELPGVSGRAGETLLLLAGALVASLLALVPGQTLPSLGLVVLLVGLPAWGVPAWIQLQAWRDRSYQRRAHAVSRLLLHQAATVPFLLGGIALGAGFEAGLYGFAAALVLSTVVALINAWVLLVEIVR